MKSSTAGFWIYILALSLVLCSGAGWRWYRAGVQAEVYRRQGIEMSHWEVFVGAAPAERTINIRDSP